MAQKVIQIIPLVDWYVSFDNGDGTYYSVPLTGAWLDDNGEIGVFDIDASGHVELYPRKEMDCVGIWHRSQIPGAYKNKGE